MAKNKFNENPVVESQSTETPVVETQAETQEVSTTKFRLYCHAPTPLASNPFECEAESEEAAKQEFFKANGITGTDSKIDVQKTG